MLVCQGRGILLGHAVEVRISLLKGKHCSIALQGEALSEKQIGFLDSALGLQMALP